MHGGATHIAFDAYDRLSLCDFMDFEAQSHTPSDRCVRFAVAVTDACATLATGRPATALPGPDFHRLERASFLAHEQEVTIPWGIGQLRLVR